MTEKLTWSEFAEKYQPKDGDKFTDDRGQEWKYQNRGFYTDMCFIGIDTSAKVLTCPLIPPKQKRKMWPAISYLAIDTDSPMVSDRLFKSFEQAKEHFAKDAVVIWPAVPNEDGSYDVD